MLYPVLYTSIMYTPSSTHIVVCVGHGGGIAYFKSLKDAQDFMAYIHRIDPMIDCYIVEPLDTVHNKTESNQGGDH